MDMAIKKAREAGASGEVPIAAVIVDGNSGEVLAITNNSKEDPTAHAEMLAIRAACKKIGESRLNECDMYVTLEPCPMCAQAISFARIRRLYYGASDPKGGGVENGPRIFNSPTCHSKPEVYGHIQEEECGRILKEFFKNRR